MLLNCGVGEDSWESLGLQGDPTSPSKRKSVLNIYWKDWWWSWNSNTLATWCEELADLKRPWCWEGLNVGGEGDDRGWIGWMASPTQWTWVWVNSMSCWWTERLGVLQSMGHKESYMTERLNWTEKHYVHVCMPSHFSHVQPCATIGTVPHQAPLSMGFSGEDHRIGFPCPPLGDLPHPGIETVSLISPELTGGFFTTSATWEAPQTLHILPYS